MRKGEGSASVGPVQCERIERSQSPEQPPQFVVPSPQSFRRTIRRTELHKMVPLSGTTIVSVQSAHLESRGGS